MAPALPNERYRINTMTPVQTQRKASDMQALAPDTIPETGVDRLSGVCSFTRVSDNHARLLEQLSEVLPGLVFEVALTRGGWHRTGGLVDSAGERISYSLAEWIEQTGHGDIAQLCAEFAEAGYVVTHLHGKTHYLVARTGPEPQDFIQLEVEELQEVTDHALFNGKEFPDDFDDLIEPVSLTPVAPECVGNPRYAFRRITSIADYLTRMSDRNHKSNAVRRFIDDWSRSSAGECGTFSDHWVLVLHEYTDAYGQPVMLARPVTTHTGEIPRLEKKQVCHGSKLANMIHGFDRDMGYPMAWYFYMLTHSNVTYQLVEAIHDDQMGAYDYLPPKDLAVLIDWYNQPYSI